jgi:hypothetical protein
MPQTILQTAQQLEMDLSPGQEATLRLLYGLPIDDPEQQRLALKATGRETLGADRHYKNAHILAGRRSGKSTRLVALVVIHEALFAGHVIQESEDSYLPVIAPIESQARKTFKTIMRLLDKHFPNMIVGEPKFSAGESEIELRTRITIQVCAARINAVRGGACVAVIFEEACHFGREDRSAHPLSEIVGSLRPALLTHADTNGKMVFVSSPWVKSGLMFEAHRDRATNKDFTLVVQLPSKDLNPSLSEAEMFVMRKLQGEGWYQREFLSEFVDSGEPMIPAEAIEAAVTYGRESFLPEEKHAYVAGFDLSARGDDSALGIAHSFEGVVSLDCCQLWKRPQGQNTIDPFMVLQQACESMKSYGVVRAFSDQVLQSVVEHTVKKHGIDYQRCVTYGNGAAAMWRVVRELFVSGKVRIPENKTLIQQLKSLEQKFLDGGGQAVEARRGKDDLAVAAALAIYQAYSCANNSLAPWFEVMHIPGGKPAGGGTGKTIPGQGVDTGWSSAKIEDRFGNSDIAAFLPIVGPNNGLGVDWESPNPLNVSVVETLPGLKK